MRTVTKNYHDVDTSNGGLALELPFPMSSIMDYKPVLLKETDDQIIIGYLADDSDCESPEDDNYFGRICEARRNGPTLADFNRAMGWNEYGEQVGERDPYAVMLDYYEHGQCQYSLAGEGMQCRFDTVKGNVCWVPSEILRQELEQAETIKTGAGLARARELAKSAAEQYTAWRNGDTYGVVVATYDFEGEFDSSDECWGFLGGDYAYDSLKSDYFPSETK